MEEARVRTEITKGKEEARSAERMGLPVSPLAWAKLVFCAVVWSVGGGTYSY